MCSSRSWPSLASTSNPLGDVMARNSCSIETARVAISLELGMRKTVRSGPRGTALKPALPRISRVAQPSCAASAAAALASLVLPTPGGPVTTALTGGTEERSWWRSLSSSSRPSSGQSEPPSLRAVVCAPFCLDGPVMGSSWRNTDCTVFDWRCSLTLRPLSAGWAHS